MTETVLMIVAMAAGGLILLVAEICIPSMGLLALAAIACFGGAIYECFTISQALGVLTLLATAIILPIYLYLVVKKLPGSFLGKLLTLKADLKPAGEGTPEASQQKPLVGRKAVAETNLRPSGAIRVDGQRLIATAESGFISRGATVEILKAVGMNVVVREVAPPPAEAAPPIAPPAPPADETKA